MAMKLRTMALRNLGRNRRRTLLASLSVAIAMLIVMFLDGFIGGFMGNIVSNYTKNDVGDLNVTTEGYRQREKFMPLSEYIRDSAGVATAIRSLPELKGRLRTVEERIRFGVILSSGPSSKAALGVAGDPETERGLLMLDRSILPGGSYLSKPGDAIIGAGIAKDLGLKVGDPLKIVTQKADGGIGFKRFRVSGIFSTNVNALDGSIFQVGLEDARDLLGMPGGATQVIVMLKDYRDAAKSAAAVAAALPKAGHAGLSTVPWTKTGAFADMMVLMSRLYGWIYAVIAFLGAFVIANVMMMVVLERKKEIGLLKAMGMPRREILGLFLMEGSMLGVLGSAAGVALGLGLCGLFSVVGMDFSSAMASFSWPMDNIIYATVSPLDALALFLLGVAVAAVIAFLPSRSAATMDPIEAIRSV
jgi:putative ABC transport system permease protein